MLLPTARAHHLGVRYSYLSPSGSWGLYAFERRRQSGIYGLLLLLITVKRRSQVVHSTQPKPDLP